MTAALLTLAAIVSAVGIALCLSGAVLAVFWWYERDADRAGLVAGWRE